MKLDKNSLFRKREILLATVLNPKRFCCFKMQMLLAILSETFSMLSVSEMSIELTSGIAIRLARMCYLISIMEMLQAVNGCVVWTCVTAIKPVRMFCLTFKL